jgi:hypothetical protein
LAAITILSLARVKKLPSNSASLVKSGHGNYRAPECDKLAADAPPSIVRRSSVI